MSEASKHSCRLTLLLGLVMAVAAAAVGAMPLAEKVSDPKPEKVAKSKALRFIENRPASSAKAHADMKKIELPATQQLPASESPPLELKGVRG